MKFKKHMLILPAIALISLGSTFVFANTNSENNQEIEMAQDLSERAGLVSRINGEVTEINKNTIDDVDYYHIVIKDEDSKESIINILEDTLFLIDGEIVNIDNIEVGMKIEVHYKGSGIISGPLLLDLNEEDLVALENGEYREINVLDEGIARFFASAIVANSEGSYVSVHVDIFNEELVSTDYSLRLSINEDTEIVDINGNAYEGSIENKKLAVVYLASTKSLPAIPINPKIIVFNDTKSLYGVVEKSEEPINMLDFLPEFARGNARTNNNIQVNEVYEVYEYNYNEDDSIFEVE